jgi:hypothetical protein
VNGHKSGTAWVSPHVTSEQFCLLAAITPPYSALLRPPQLEFESSEQGTSSTKAY